ncbi:TyrS [Heracleum sosnowskyi]|uniref:TyrS n=1 Tax=Heracleum sosnowskyi TaxID=360622 RepID=A0AAD8J9Q5_9APIA|nr:TyrS [Heracleum sosnowskyi]
MGSLGLASDSYPDFSSSSVVDFDSTTYEYPQPDLSLNNDDFQGKNRGLKKKKAVLLERNDEDELGRTKSLSDEDLEELKGCLDLGFGFSYDEIPELCNTLPALELCYSLSQKFLDDQQHHQKCPDNSSYSVSLPDSPSPSPPSGPIANWKISSPGDHPEDVKARLKFWAQAVACTVKLCN